MMDGNENKINEYNYYNADGIFIGHSEGQSPQEDLFKQAHYVFSNDNETIKNGDTVSNIEKDLEKYRKDLLHISVSHIGRLMDLNKKIKNLEDLLEQKKAEQNEQLKQAG